MQRIGKIWNNFKLQPDIWFFVGFLITFTLSVRKVLKYFPIQDQFNEYAGVYVYLSDIFLLLTPVSWLISILYNKHSNLSIDKLKKGHVWLPFLLVVWSFLSIEWSENQKIAIFRAIKLLEFYWLYLYIVLRFKSLKCSTPAPWNVPCVPREMFPACPVKCSTWNIFTGVEHFHWGGTFSLGWNILMKIIISLAIVQSIIAIFQFIFQHSLGLFGLKESIINSDILGVAKVIIDGDKFIRSYGLFPHPNVLGGFLLFSIIVTVLYYKMFHIGSKENVPPASRRQADVSASRGGLGTFSCCGTDVEQNETFLYINCSTWNKCIIMLQLLALLLTFSKSAIVGLFLAGIYLIWKNVPPASRRQADVSASRGGRGTIITFWRKIYVKIGIAIVIMLTLFVVMKIDLHSFFLKSLEERSFYINVSRGTILDNVLFGSGMGQFVLNMQKHLALSLSFWQFQPVHNVFLLIWSDLGFIGLALFFFFLFEIFVCKNVPPASRRQVDISASRGGRLPREMFHVEHFHWGGTFQPESYCKAILIGFMFIMLFDHYLWDIQQGQIMFWLVAGLMVVFKGEEVANIDKID